jgi:hypothetical protein
MVLICFPEMVISKVHSTLASQRGQLSKRMTNFIMLGCTGFSPFLLLSSLLLGFCFQKSLPRINYMHMSSTSGFAEVCANYISR